MSVALLLTTRVYDRDVQDLAIFIQNFTENVLKEFDINRLAVSITDN